MSNLRPDQLSGVSSLSSDDIIIAEINPNDPERKVVKITSSDLLSGVTPSSTIASNIGEGVDLVSGIQDNDIKIKSINAGDNVTIISGDESITISASGGGGTPVTTSPFSFFSNALNNIGVIEKTLCI